MNTNMIKELERAGYIVEVRHWRILGTNNALLAYPEISKDLRKYISPHGGATEVTLVNSFGQEFTYKSRCSQMDCFSRKRGTTIALGRAISDVINKHTNFVS